MRIIPKTDDEIRKSLLLPEGTYDFEVESAEETISKKGNPMVVVKLRVFTGEGGSRIVTDYLMEAMQFKLRHYMHAVGLGGDYDAGNVDASTFQGRSGRVALSVEDQPGYPPKNTVDDYLVPDESKAASTAAKVKHTTVSAAVVGAAAAKDDGIPF